MLAHGTSAARGTPRVVCAVCRRSLVFGRDSPISSSNTGSDSMNGTGHRVARVVPFAREQLFDVVADVENYKLFLPYCEDSVVLRRVNPSLMTAQLAVGFSVFSERYTSRVRLARPNSIRTTAIDSQMFTRLESLWEFREGPKPGTAHVEFSVDFQVADPMAAKAIDLFFGEIVKKQIQAFEERCHHVYGRPS